MASQQSEQQPVIVTVNNDERPEHPPAYGYGTIVSGQQNRPFAVVNQPITIPKEFPEQPIHTKCGTCGACVVSRTFYECGMCTHLVACGLFVLTGICCIWVYFCDCTKDVDHVCPNCNAQLGRYYRAGTS